MSIVLTSVGKQFFFKYKIIIYKQKYLLTQRKNICLDKIVKVLPARSFFLRIDYKYFKISGGILSFLDEPDDVLKSFSLKKLVSAYEGGLVG